MKTVLSLNNISKSYNAIKALNNVSFDVPEGCVFGILGPNGSGKTTLLGIVLDVLQADNGAYQWLENTPGHEARKQIGSLLETPNFYHYLSAMDNLMIAAKIKGRGAANRESVLQKLKLFDRRDSKFHTYSLGMKQRLAIAAALLGSPKVLVFDEPTNGLDPEGIAEIRSLIKKLNNEGITIIMASHLLDEVEKVCTHVAILKKGNLLLSGAVDDVLRSEDVIEIKAGDMRQLQNIIAKMPDIKKINSVNGFIQLAGDNIYPEMVNEYCMKKGTVLSHVLLKKKSLESKFIELTQDN